MSTIYIAIWVVEGGDIKQMNTGFFSSFDINFSFFFFDTQCFWSAHNMQLLLSLAMLPSLALGGLVARSDPSPTYAGTCTFYASEGIWNAWLQFALATIYSTTCTPAPTAGPLITANCVQTQGIFAFETPTPSCEQPAVYTTCTPSLSGLNIFTVCATPTFAASPSSLAKYSIVVSLPSVPTTTSIKISTSTSTSIVVGSTSVVVSLPSVSTSLSSVTTSQITLPSVTQSQSISSTLSAVLSSNTGCFADNINGGGRTFSDAWIASSSSMTNEFCQSYCSNLGFPYSGTEYSAECFCSDNTPSVSSTQCTMPCSGNSKEICGGPNALSVSYNTTLGIAIAAKHAVASSFNSYGCYKDNYPSRVLTGSSYESPAMTVDNCIGFCNSNGYTIAGVEYSSQCFCGNSLLTDGSNYGVASQSGCTYACSGDHDKICGGANLLNIYSISPVLATQNTASAVSVPFTAANAAVGGCASDYVPGNSGVRTLSSASTVSSGMTQEACSAFCSNYRYYGVEYSTECYCGNTINSRAVVASNCTNTCAGNSQESCGGGWAINIFTHAV